MISLQQRKFLKCVSQEVTLHMHGSPRPTENPQTDLWVAVADPALGHSGRPGACLSPEAAWPAVRLHWVLQGGWPGLFCKPPQPLPADGPAPGTCTCAISRNQLRSGVSSKDQLRSRVFGKDQLRSGVFSKD